MIKLEETIINNGRFYFKAENDKAYSDVEINVNVDLNQIDVEYERNYVIDNVETNQSIFPSNGYNSMQLVKLDFSEFKRKIEYTDI